MEYGAFSHKGLQRRSNEDHYYIPKEENEKPALLIVADGMGGHNAGDLASRIAVEYVTEYFLKSSMDFSSSEDLIKAINQSIEEANEKVYNLSMTDIHFSGMGTTLTMAVFDNDHIHVAHIGDSRCYLLRHGLARQITRDHSLVQELLDNGSITRDEMDIHPKKNVITRALGTEDKLKVDFFEETLEEGDIVLLCTDGLINYVNIEEYAKILPQNISMAEMTEILGNEALAAGGSDDITIVAARYTGIGRRGDVLAG